MRIAIAGMATESCTFSPLTTKYEDFRVRRGAEILESMPAVFEPFDAEWVPVLIAGAMPGGPVEADAYARYKVEIVAGLRDAGPIDGVFLSLHGAMNVVGMDDAEADLVDAIRGAVGAEVPISASFDLHGNISKRLAAQLDMLSAYRTAPHIDYMETRQRALSLLVRSIQLGVRPEVARVRIPVVLPGERTSTEWEPGASLYCSLDAIDHAPGVIHSSLLVGYVWADEPRASATAIVTGTDRAACEVQAAKLAQDYWDARADFDFGVQTGTMDDCIGWALEAPESCVFISDSGDNPTAGGVGDVPAFIGRLLAHDVPDAVYASVVDAAAFDACRRAGVGGRVDVSLGGKLDPVHGEPLPVSGTVAFIYPGGDHNGHAEPGQAVIKVGGVRVIVTAGRKAFHYIADFERLNIDPLAHKIVIVKIGYLVPDLKRAAPHALLALSPGAVNQDIPSLTYERIRRPIYPLDPEMDWTPDNRTKTEREKR